LCPVVEVSWIYLPECKTPYMLDDPVTKLKKNEETLYNRRLNPFLPEFSFKF
jgi:hypothetical protein